MIAALWLASSAAGNAMTYYLVDGGSWWPADVRARIVAAMNEAVAVYNANGYFNVDVRVVWNTGIPTAQASFNGELGFGGNAGFQTARVAIHEISHYCGTGTHWAWDSKFTNDVWNGAAARHFMKLYDGPGGELRKAGVHYYPFGLNYDSEDSGQNRIREAKLVREMRYDMGITGDGDGDTLPDDWETWRFGNTIQTAAGDPDADGISNYDEWRTESDPMRPCPVKDGKTYIIRSRLSQKVMEVANNSLANGGNVRQNPADGTNGQKWTARYVGGGYWRFFNFGSGKILEVTGVSWNAGANIQQWENLGNDGQQWRIVPNGGLYSKIFNKASMNMVVDVDGGPNALGNGTNISQYFDDLGAANQDWTFEDVAPGESPKVLMAEYKLDGNGRDSSGRSLHGTVAAGVTYSAGRVDGQAATFNGTTGSIAIPPSADTDLSIACWVKTGATGGTGQWYNGMGLVDAEVGGVSADYGLALVGNKAGFGIGKNDFTITSANAINDGQWHHLVATRENVSGAMKIYVDGALQASGTGPTGPRIGPAKMSLGSIAGVTGFFNGSLDEVRVYSKVLNLTEISRLAAVGNTLVGSYAFDGDVRDASSHSNHGDATAVTYSAGKVGTSALQLNGTNGFVQLPASVVSDFTVAFWLKTPATGTAGAQWYNGKPILDAEVPGAANDWGVGLIGGKIAFGIGNPDTTILSGSNINDDTWHHVALSRSGVTGALRLYIDGEISASGVGPASARNIPGGLRLGRALFGASALAAAVDDLKIYNYVLGATQVSALTKPVSNPQVVQDIGNPGSDGYSGYTTGSQILTLTGGGAGIGGTSDQFHFVSAPVQGNQSLITRIIAAPTNSAGDTANNARAGLMFRNSDAQNAPFVSLLYDFTTGLRLMYRNSTGASGAQEGASVPISAPVWVKLRRNGDVFDAFYANPVGTPTEAEWIAIGSHTTSLQPSPIAGLVVSSQNALQVAVANFGNFQVLSPAELWRQENFGSVTADGDASDDADPDYDGFTNFFERAYGLNPRLANTASQGPVITKEENFLTMSYTRSLAANDMIFQVLWSNDLSTWSATDVIDTMISSTPLSETRLAKVPIAPPLDPLRGFLRLKIER